MIAKCRRLLVAVAAAALVAAPGTAGPARAVAAGDCTQGTVMNVVAHEDDDLLFLSPDLQHDIDNGLCVITVYLTAGDAYSTFAGADSAAGQHYWRDGRENGELAAYARMGGVAWGWYEVGAGVPGRVIQAVDNGESGRLRLVFLRLKDGLQGKDGNPDVDTPVKTLWKAWRGLSNLRSLYDSEHPERRREYYTRQQLIDTLGVLYTRTPNLLAIRTLDPRPEMVGPDHPDHVATALFALAARDQHAPDVPILGYWGYPATGFPVNVTGSDFDRKYATFYTYAQHDDHVCSAFDLGDPCLAGFSAFYRDLLARQYPLW